MNSTQYLISLREASALLQVRYCEYAIKAKQAKLMPGGQRFTTLEYDYRDYLKLLLDEIFANPDSPHYGLKPAELASTALLRKAGLDPEYAVRLGAEVFKCVVDEVSTAVPNVRFSDFEHYQYGYIDTGDLWLTIQ